MKKTTKRPMLTALVLTAILFLCTGCHAKPEEQRMQESFDNITKIDAEMEIADVTLFSCPGEAVTLEYCNYGDDRCIIEQQNGTLRIRREYPRFNWQFLIGRQKDYTLLIGIPENYTGELSVINTTGKISAAGLSLPGNAAFTVTTGSISLQNITAAGDMRIRMTTGSIEGKELTCGVLSVTSTTGKVTLAGAADRFEIKTTTGAVDAELTAVTQSASIETTTGSIRCRIHDSAQNFKITGRTTTGSRDIPSGGDGPKQLEVNATTGSVRVEFTE